MHRNRLALLKAIQDHGIGLALFVNSNQFFSKTT